jgi:hypothetical protein
MGMEVSKKEFIAVWIGSINPFVFLYIYKTFSSAFVPADNVLRVHIVKP